MRAARKWSWIVIHHSGTVAGTMASLREHHLADLAMSDVAYHFIIRGSGPQAGEVEIAARWTAQRPGAHAGVREYNEQGIGICLVGDFERTTVSPRQFAAALRLVRALQEKFGIPAGHVVLHRDIRATSCPGKYFPIARFRDALVP